MQSLLNSRGYQTKHLHLHLHLRDGYHGIILLYFYNAINIIGPYDTLYPFNHIY